MSVASTTRRRQGPDLRAVAERRVLARCTDLRIGPGALTRESGPNCRPPGLSLQLTIRGPMTDGTPATEDATPGRAMTDAESQLLEFLKGCSFKRGTFKLASGALSDYYIDGKMSEVHPKGAFL